MFVCIYASSTLSLSCLTVILRGFFGFFAFIDSFLLGIPGNAYQCFNLKDGKAKRNNNIRLFRTSFILGKPASVVPKHDMMVQSFYRFLSTREFDIKNALFFYDNPIDQRDQIRKDNNGKSVIYA